MVVASQSAQEISLGRLISFLLSLKLSNPVVLQKIGYSVQFFLKRGNEAGDTFFAEWDDIIDIACKMASQSQNT